MRVTLGALIAAMRPRHWVKNLFVLAPLVFAAQATDSGQVARSALALVFFSLIAGSVYLVNDVADARQDRAHPRKRDRPVASGRLRPATALTAGALLCALAITGALLLRPTLAAVLAGYGLLNLLYSLGLKRAVGLDVLMVAVGFVLRVLGGAVSIQVEASHWVLLCTLLLALFIALNKRRAELVLLEGSEGDHRPGDHRPVLSQYTIPFLDQMSAMVAGATIVAYALYTVSPETVAKFGGDRLIFTVPFIIFGLWRFLYLTHGLRAGEGPTEVVLRDVPLLACIGAWLLTCFIIIYG